MAASTTRWREHWRAFGDRPAFVGGGEPVSFGQLEALVGQAAAEVSAAGVAPGDVVVACAEFSARWSALLFALTDCKAITVPRLPGNTDRGFVCGARWSICWDENGTLIIDATAREICSFSEYDSLRTRSRAGLVLFSGGSTGAAKGVVHDLDRFLDNFPLRTNREKRILPLMAPDHVGGLDMLLRALATGTTVVNPGAGNVESATASLVQWGPDVVAGTPSFLGMLALAVGNVPHPAEAFEKVTSVVYGAEAMLPATKSLIGRTFSGATIRMRFGTTETGASDYLQQQDRPEVMDLSQHTDTLRVVDGELWVRIPESFVGYLGDAPASKHSIVDGWFRTGDLVEEDETGAVRIAGRRANLINVGGEKVLPEKVENAVASHPNVSACRAYGVPHALLGQTVAVDVVWNGDPLGGVDLKSEIVEFSKGTLAGFERPVRVRRVEKIETTSVGKIARRGELS